MAHETVAAYGAHARAYRDGTRDLPGNVRVDLDDFAAAVGEGGRVLEIGSGGGRDAEFLEHHGLSIRRTDVTPAFVDLLRADGYAADVLDPLTDDLADPTRSGEMYDAVWANACLLHVAREDLPAVLARLREVTRPGGRLRFSVKEGEGEAWSTHGRVAAPRLFVFWSEPDLRTVVEGSGWTVVKVGRARGKHDDWWLGVWARRQERRGVALRDTSRSSAAHPTMPRSEQAPPVSYDEPATAELRAPGAAAAGRPPDDCS